ncbi:CTP:molybdopterin cytidylyltransferase MocA [Chitinophaga sp. YR573]|uniref:XdhC family protein n=1 Tax=Chitinophaga sp. YR573 TaxID=1881040 RepID=UPI0008C66A79|nr:XdhC family protein [Chitinophaga sp. YR573]SEW25079.1 CTP:molybdopterin cytidylyltransferase MocA [Chitinophaga sp. YR573]
MKEIRQIIRAFETAFRQHKKMVLATVVHIEGSAYRAPGARMLVSEDGTLMGTVSGGCLEGDVLRKALLVMTEEKPALITYDTSDETDTTGLGVSLGCNGIIRILLEPIPAHQDHNPITLLQLAVATRQPSVLVTFFTPDNKKYAKQGTRLIVNADGTHIVDDIMPVAYSRMDADIRQVLATQSSAFIRYAPYKTGETAVHVFFEFLIPGPALVVAGAGNDVLPLAHMAAILGWELTLIDGRPSYATSARFPSCQVIVAKPEEALQSVTIDEQTAVVLMSHNYFYDKSVLIQALQSPAAYFGILGPQKKRDRLLQELQEQGITLSAQQRARIYGPIGLDIGAETAEEIALSIISEIKAVFAGRTVGSLRNKSGKIHKRSTCIASPMETYGIVILAAGESKRLGTSKQQLIFRGDTLLRNTVRTALELGTAATVVVAGKAAATIKQQLEDMSIELVINAGYAEGMASSIREGVKHLCGKHPHVAHILIMLCDQPYVDVTHLRRLVYQQQLTAAPVAASNYAGRNGVPALFHQSVFPQLLALEGDTGAKHVIEGLGEAVTIVPFPEGVVDVDTMEAYQKIM